MSLRLSHSFGVDQIVRSTAGLIILVGVHCVRLLCDAESLVKLIIIFTFKAVISFALYNNQTNSGDLD